jgi:hypothetical protein
MNVTELHNAALDLADEAFFLRKKGNLVGAIELFKEAYHLEIKAAFQCASFSDNEPTRSILFKSAAHLANNAHLYELAAKAVHNALAGDAPQSISEELYELLDELSFRKHLLVKGVSLGSDEIQVSLSGPGVDKGLVQYNEMNSRVEVVTRMVTRTAERIQGRDFRTSGRSYNMVNYQPYMSVARAQSYAFTLRFAKPASAQMSIPGFETSHIVPNLFRYVGLIEERNAELIKAEIKNVNYLSNFIALAKELAPDGKNISTVGFSYNGPNGIIDCPLRTTRAEITRLFSNMGEAKDKSEYIHSVGKLSLADSDKSLLKFTPDGNKSSPYEIRVSRALDDVVRLYWGQKVDVTLTKKKGAKALYTLLEISQA